MQNNTINTRYGISYAFKTVSLSLCLSTLAPVFAGSSELRTADEALEQTLAYAGFEQIGKFTRPEAAASAATVEVIDTTTPLLSERISGKDRWVVTFENVYLEMDSIWSTYNHSIQLRKTYQFYLDRETGQLLKVVGRTDSDTCRLSPLPHVSDSERYFQAAGQSYAGVPVAPPPVSFFEALKHARFAQPLRAKEIYAWLVLDASNGIEPQARWVIVGRGTPPGEVFGVNSQSPGKASESSLITCYMCKIDANTGEGLSCRNLMPWDPELTE